MAIAGGSRWMDGPSYRRLFSPSMNASRLLEQGLRVAFTCRSGGVILLAGMAVFFGANTASAALTKDSPEVKQAVARAIDYLEKNGAGEQRLGGQAIIALALKKHGAGPSHPLIVRAVDAIRKQIGNPGQLGSHVIYSTGISLVFLCELDPEEYRPEIQALVDYLMKVQKPHGGWGYLERTTGDTSMVQYALLGLWEAHYSGYEVPEDVIERATMWLMQTQDPTGGFGYQGVIGEISRPVPQESVSLVLTTAATGSLYICGDLLGLGRQAPAEGPKLPKALVRVETDKPSGAKIDRRTYLNIRTRGEQWIRANFQIDPVRYRHYYIYALERYGSFREAAEGRMPDLPNWYDDGARYLIRTQTQVGNWPDVSGAGPAVDTAFGALFLMRSMKETIERIKPPREFGAGTLVGGRGIPKQTDSLEIQMGRLVNVPDLSEIDDMLSILGDPTDENHSEAADALAAVALDEKGAEVISRHAARLRELARGDSPEARLAAVRALGQARDLNDVPTLIYALQDPDLNVMRAARDSLLRISRKFEGFGPSDEPSDDERRQAIERWKAWYLAVRPDADFEAPTDNP